jgi:DNA-binding NarL/FixJ family response regulator
MVSSDAARNARRSNAVWPDSPESSALVALRQARPTRPEISSSGGDRLGLTGFELHLVSELLAGYEDAEIARRASLSRPQLSSCVAALFEKLGVRDRLELALLLVQNGL